MPFAAPPLRSGSLSEQKSLISSLRDPTPFELGQASTQIRSVLSSFEFEEVLLSPFTQYPIDFEDEVIDVPGIGQLRFNTEPEIWAASEYAHRFYSISTLFRRESSFNILRRAAFSIVDFYQIGDPSSLLPIFHAILERLATTGLTEHLSRLSIEKARFDPEIDGPRSSVDEPRWVITSGYDASHSFYEIDAIGVSTRRELFLLTPQGHLEVGVFGITGKNHNPAYMLRSSGEVVPDPDFSRSGMCLGLERLLLADRILSAMDA